MGHNPIIDLHHRPTRFRTACEHRCPCRHTENPRFDGVAPDFRSVWRELPSVSFEEADSGRLIAATETLTDDLFKEEHRSQAGEYLCALRRRWMLILACRPRGLDRVAFIATADKKYEAGADILVTPFADSTGAFEGITLFRDPSSSIYAAGRIMTTPATTDAVIERLDLGVSREDLLGRVKIRPLEQSGIVSIIAEAGSPEAAAGLANTFAEIFIERRKTEFRAS